MAAEAQVEVKMICGKCLNSESRSDFDQIQLSSDSTVNARFRVCPVASSSYNTAEDPPFVCNGPSRLPSY